MSVSRLGRGPAPARGRRLHYPTPNLVDVGETPKRPSEVQLNRNVAQQRREELQDIFTSRHSDRCEELRARLAALDAEAGQLRNRITTLEGELRDATDERMAKTDTKGAGRDRFSNVDGQSERETVCSAGTVENVVSEVGKIRPGSFVDRLPVIFNESSPTHHNEDVVPALQTDTTETALDQVASAGDWMTMGPSDNEMVPPLLQRRRAEARYREAASCHGSIITHMQNEIAALTRRIHKQKVWMRHVEDQVLKAEMAKTRYQVRLDSARLRSKTLAQDLSKAYVDMARLMKDRMDVEGVSAQNDALLLYTDHVRKADEKNEANFIENREMLMSLQEVCKRAHATRRDCEKVMDEVREKENITREIIENAETLACVTDQLQKLWIAVPANIKGWAFTQNAGSDVPVDLDGKTSSAVHPSVALRTIRNATIHILESQQHYQKLLAEASAKQIELLGDMDGIDEAVKDVPTTPNFASQ
mmetsp:Transcript_119299/g.337467  ORF Transcript_119299/g.337467 Transcript_119299/m.337467 type:complete len:476 (-) Transcript_119299:2-1429(-)